MSGIRKVKKRPAKRKKSQKLALKVQNLTKSFGKFTAVSNISFAVQKGKIHGFIGPNGAGKTTTIKSIISAMKFNRGKIFINGIVNSSPIAKKQIGYIPEAARFPKGISTYEYLVSMGNVSGISRKHAKILTREFLIKYNLWKFRRKNPNKFSSGMKKTILLNQALLNNPEILILDEPATNLDPTARTDLFNELKQLRKQGKTIFISSHILSELQTIVDEITILNHGKVIYSRPIKNAQNNKYIIISDNNEKLWKICQKNKMHVFKRNQQLEIIFKNYQEIKKFQKLVVKNNLIITKFDKEKIDLQQLYVNLVMPPGNETAELMNQTN